jgi:hypothetical protein
MASNTIQPAASKRQILVSQIAAWSLSVVVSTVAFIAWGESNGWQVAHFNAYQFFPLLGLLAWSLMWAHYVMAAVREQLGLAREVLAKYFRWTGYAVLVAICLHPGLLIYKLFRDGHGLPPASYESYVAHGLGWVTMLGTVSLLVFLAFEFHRVYGEKSWWHYVADASDFAMIAIFYHSIRLGSQLSVGGWFQALWWFYGAVLAVILVRKYVVKLDALIKKPATK